MKTLLQAVCAGTTLVCLGCQAEVPQEEQVATVSSAITIDCTVYYWDNMTCTVCYTYPGGCQDWTCEEPNGMITYGGSCP